MATTTGFLRPSLLQFVLAGIAHKRTAKSGGSESVPHKAQPRRRIIDRGFRMPSRVTRRGRKTRAKLAAAGLQRYRQRQERKSLTA